MRKLFVASCFLLGIASGNAQTLYINDGVDTTDKRVVTAIHFYRQYLKDIRFNALPDFKKYWRADKVAKYKIPDPQLYAITDFPTYLMGESKTIIYAKPLKDYVQLKTLFASTDSLNNISVTCITNHYIGFDGSNKPYFVSPLDVYTKNWKSVKLRNITYLHSPYHRFNTEKAESLITKIKKLERDWGLKSIVMEYYLIDTKDELGHLRGFDFVIGMGNNDRPAGRSDDQNNIIYASGVGEDYFHEVVHMYLNRQFKASPLREGLATFYGGSFGRDLVWHLNYLNDYLQKHPELDLNNFRSFQYLDEHSNPNYTIEGLLCLLAYQKDGLSGLKRIMSYTSLEDVFKKEFNVQPGQWNQFIRDKVLEKTNLQRTTMHGAISQGDE